TVADLIGHVVAGNARVAGNVVTTGNATDVVALESAHADSATDAQTVFGAGDGLTRTFDVPFGNVPGSIFVGLRTTDVLTHAWDLAHATDQDTDLDPELARAMHEWSRNAVRDDLRGRGSPFGPEQPEPAGAAPADQLAAFLGRRVRD